MKNQIKLVGLLFYIVIFMSCNFEKEDDQSADFYSLNINFEGDIPSDKKIDATIQLKYKDTIATYEGKIERRGGYSLSYPKSSYEFDLKKDIPFASLPADDDWILNANYIDKTFLRHVISYELFSAMNANNKASKTNFIDLQLNNAYNGLYVLMEKLDRSSLGIKKKDTSAVIFKEPHLFRNDLTNVKPQYENNFHQQTYPKIKDDDKSHLIDEIRSFILNSDDSKFNQEVSQIFDIENVIDWNLLLLISNNNDGILKNFYMYKVDSLTEIRFAPWDYDHSYGRDGDNELNLDRTLNLNRSILFERLLKQDWYKAKLKERWEELNELNILSQEGLKSRVSQKVKLIKNRAIQNFVRWSAESEWYHDANSFDQEIEIIYQFIDMRHEQLIKVFE